MKKGGRIVLILVAVLCFGVALSYPIKYFIEQRSNDKTVEDLQNLRQQALNAQEATATPAPTDTPEPTPSPTPEPTATPQPTDAPTKEPEGQAQASVTTLEETDDGATWYIIDSIPLTPTPEPTPSPTPSPEPSPTPDRFVRTKPLSYGEREKVELDESQILPELQAMYKINNDLIGWLSIAHTDIDYPVVQTEDKDFYLHHDFYGDENKNGQIVLYPHCDPYTPSYNLVISGHNMLSGSMFAKLVNYTSKSYWEGHKLVEFDSLLERKQYVVMAVFFSGVYDDDEEGFRYSADIQYRQDAEQWLEEIKENQIYNTGIEAEFGDEFLTLTTCSSMQRKNGRFVVICRRIREGETFQ